MVTEDRPEKKRNNLGGSIIALVIGLLLVWGAVSWISHLASPPEEPPWPEGVPRDIPRLDLVSSQIPNDKDSFLVVYEHEYGARDGIYVKFKNMGSIEGMWRGTGAMLHIPASGGTTFSGTTSSESWGDTIWTSMHLEPFSAYVKTSFVVDREYYHNWVDVKAELDVVFPVFTEGLRFTSESQSLERQLTFFVISPEEYEMLQEHIQWSLEMYNYESRFLKVLIVIGKTVVALLAAFFVASGVWGIHRALAKH